MTGILLPAVPAIAATKTWTGATNSDWGTGTNWSGAGAPASADSANINLTSGPLVSTTTAVAAIVNVGNSANGSLTISGGGVLTDASVNIGFSSGIAGTTTVSGTGSSWSNSGTLTIGVTGTGTLNIISGGTVSNTLGRIGLNATSTGTVTVSGTGSAWTNSASLIVGSTGTGTLNIQSGGAVSSATGTTIGNVAGSTGTATVDGAGSSLRASGITVGNSGTGTMNVQNGGTVNDTGGATVGGGVGSTGTATVSGAGSTWTTSGNLQVGNSGTGTLNIQNGGTVSNAIGYIATNAGSTGSVMVTGANSSWVNSANLRVGYGGTGTLNIQNDGSVSNVTGFVGFTTGGNGTVTVAGTGSIWSNSSDLLIGDAGAGTVTISNGGVTTGSGTNYVNSSSNQYTSSSKVVIANQTGSVGTLNIGAASGSPAATPGTLTASSVAFGAGTGTIVFNHTSNAYVFAPAISGTGTLDFLAGTTILAGDLSGFSGTMNISAGADLTTMAAQQTSLQSLSADQQAMAAESHATAGELLGMTRPVDNSRFIDYGAMFGSAVAYAGGQYADRGVTVLGGIAYGAQDYRNIRQGDAPTLAAALRYTFDDPFGDKAGAFRPYVELGTWITPRANLTLTRSYADLVSGGTDTAQGDTNETSWAEYGRGGLVWKATKYDQLTGYGELGQQYMSFDGYTENATGNPFPASVGGGLFRMGVARIGGSWTHDLLHLIEAPISFTLAGDAARSFNVHSGLGATFLGAVSTDASDSTDMWGEFGARIEARFTDRLALDLDLNGTTNGALGTVLHGGIGVTVEF